MIWEILFWLSFFLILYHLVLYPLILFVFNKFRKKQKRFAIIATEVLPTVTVICPAYNEESVIENKITSFLALNYPKDIINMIIISDDSTDGTNEIVKKYLDKNIELVIQKPRGGKQRAHNLVQPDITSDYILSTDANSIFEPDAVLNLVEAITADDKIGIVSGELRLVKKGQRDSGEGLYWKYECFLKKMDSDFASIIGSNGSIFLIRSKLFDNIHPSSCDDFERTLQVLVKGFRAIYVPQAIVMEDVTEHASEELSRKVRIITQEWCGLKRNLVLLNFFKYGRITFILFSHKLIRWLFFLFLILMLVSSAFLSSPFYNLIFTAQIVFYAIGLFALMAQKRNRRLPGTALIAYFTAMGIASCLAFFKFILSSDMGVWNPVRK